MFYILINEFLGTTKFGVTSSGAAKGGRRGRSAPGGIYMGAALWAMLQAIKLYRLYRIKRGFNVGTLLVVEGCF